nr:stage II sporulation protein D [Amphibacillus jilinensis]
MEGFIIKPISKEHNVFKPILIVLMILIIVALGLPSSIVLLSSKEPLPSQTLVDDQSIEHDLNEESVITVNVERSETDQVESVPLEQYVISVVASEMPADFELEALKAQALAARTYIVQYLMATGSLDSDKTITDTVQHQVYRSEEELKALWGADFNWKYEKISEAVTVTTGEILTYNDALITPAFFSTSNGKTENAQDYWENELPYLISVDSEWDKDSPRFLDQKSIPIDEVEQSLGITIHEIVSSPRMTYTESDRVQTVELGGQVFTGREIREKLDLKSTDFTIEQKDDHLVFTTKGFGHGVGMSQYGANGMAKEGKDYSDIVLHYYQGVDISMITEAIPTLVAKK